ncbi:hypothetical protein L6452_40398 [Arctium lappa]|uniref:Uncharacterized protein n=1 Tax=Arctium lappa TaxID=4217 RepID=A0ACB8XLU0_ARCLA|nr:hypothetical protein L6452_40398 [Arctium lappa]
MLSLDGVCYLFCNLQKWKGTCSLDMLVDQSKYAIIHEFVDQQWKLGDGFVKEDHRSECQLITSKGTLPSSKATHASLLPRISLQICRGSSELKKNSGLQEGLMFEGLTIVQECADQSVFLA